MSAHDTRDVVLKAHDLVRDAKAAGPSLRRVLADAIGIGTSPDSKTVTAIVGEVQRYGGLPSDATASAWWDCADKSARMRALSETAACLV